MEISHYQARVAGKEVTFAEAKAGVPDEKLISPEDTEAAFLEAAKQVSSKCASSACPCKTNCDKQTLLQKIQKLRKKYEDKNKIQTP